MNDLDKHMLNFMKFSLPKTYEGGLTAIFLLFALLALEKSSKTFKLGAQ